MSILHARVSGTLVNDRGQRLELSSATALKDRGPCVVAELRQVDTRMQALTELGEQPPDIVSGMALIDTGASITCVNESSARQAGFIVIDQGIMSSTSHSNHKVPIFAGEIVVTNIGKLPVSRVMGANLDDQGIIALIGRDVLQHAILVYTGLDGAFSLSL